MLITLKDVRVYETLLILRFFLWKIDCFLLFTWICCCESKFFKISMLHAFFDGGKSWLTRYQLKCIYVINWWTENNCQNDKSEDFMIIFVTRLIFCFSFNLLANKDLPLNVDIHLLILRNFLKSCAECSPFDVTMAKATCILKPLWRSFA